MSAFRLVQGVATILFLFVVINFVHFKYFPVRVVLYDAVFDICLAIMIFMGAVLLRGRDWRMSELAFSSLLGFSLATNFAIVVPTVIDRSLSIYILEKLEQRGGSVRLSAWDALLKQEFFDEYKLVDIRMTEQVNSGTVRIVNGCVELTARGRFIADITSLYRRNMLPRHRDIMGVYTDALVDPLKDSKPKVNTDCQP